MKNLQRIILWKCYLAVFFIASTAYLQAQTDYTSGDLDINAPGSVPSNVTTITRIDGTLTIGGMITEFPNFAALEVVEGNLFINGIANSSLTDLRDIFPVLDSIRLGLSIRSNAKVKTITGFASLDSVGGHLWVRANGALTSIPTFSALKSTGRLRISDNASLTTISGFAALTRIVEVVQDDGTIFGGSIDIDFNASLATISGFAALMSIEDVPLGDGTISGDISLLERMKS